MNYKKIKALIYVLSAFSVIAFTLTINVEATDLGFSVQMQQPKSQIDPKVSYLDLRLEPLQEEEIVTIVKNKSKKKPLDIEINYSSAKTNSEGIVEYAPYDMPTDNSLKVNFEEVVRGPKEFRLKPGEEREVKFQLQMPKEPFDGYIAGGIEMKQVTKKVNKELLGTEFSYIIGMRMSQNSNKVSTTMEYKKIQVGYRFGKPTIMIYFSNTSSKYIENMEVNVNIKKTGKKKILGTKTVGKLRMAPNSMMMFPFQVDNQHLKTGNYMAEINISTKDGFKKNWEEPFLYKLENEGKYGDTKPKEFKSKRTVLGIAIVVITSIFILVVGYLFFRFIKKG